MSNVIQFPTPPDPENKIFKRLWPQIGAEALQAQDAGNSAKAELLAGLAMLTGSALAIVCNGDMAQVRRLLVQSDAVILDMAGANAAMLKAFDKLPKS